jgi:hypothetical protein
VSRFGTQKFSIPMEHSITDGASLDLGFGGLRFSFQSGGSHYHDDELPTMGNLMIAGGGYAYVTYLYIQDTGTRSCVVAEISVHHRWLCFRKGWGTHSFSRVKDGNGGLGHPAYARSRRWIFQGSFGMSIRRHHDGKLALQIRRVSDNVLLFPVRPDDESNRRDHGCRDRQLSVAIAAAYARAGRGAIANA